MSNYDSFFNGKAFGRKEDKDTTNNKIKHITVELDDISYFSLNPRRADNPEFENIKESIRAIGLENPLTLTKRPGESGYTLFNGGNTRLKALKELYAETGDDKYRFQDCKLVPYQSDSEMLIRHLVENETRGDMLLIDKAMAAYQIKQLHEQESKTTLSARKLSDILCESGWPVKFKTVSIFMFVAENLANKIPIALNAGMGRPKIEQIRKMYHAIKQYVDQRLISIDSINGTEAQQSFLNALSEHDEADIDLNYALDDVCAYISKKVDIDAPRVHFEILYVIEHGEVFSEKSAMDGINDLGQKITTEPEVQSEPIETQEDTQKSSDIYPANAPNTDDGIQETEAVSNIDRASLYFREHVKYMFTRYEQVKQCLSETFEMPYFEASSDSVDVLADRISILSAKLNDSTELGSDDLRNGAVCIQLIDLLSAYFTVNSVAIDDTEDPRRQYWISLIDDINHIEHKNLRHIVNAHFYGFFDNHNDEVMDIAKDFKQLAQYSLQLIKASKED